jgi:molybdopterin converting factor small subunit
VSVPVRIPTPLRTVTRGEAQVDAAGGTIREVIADLEAKFPGLRDRICDENGDIRRFVNVYVGDEDIRFLQGIDTPVGDGTQISIIPAVAGGSGGPVAGGR